VVPIRFISEKNPGRNGRTLHTKNMYMYMKTTTAPWQYINRKP